MALYPVPDDLATPCTAWKCLRLQEPRTKEAGKAAYFVRGSYKRRLPDPRKDEGRDLAAEALMPLCSGRMGQSFFSSFFSLTSLTVTLITVLEGSWLAALPVTSM